MHWHKLQLAITNVSRSTEQYALRRNMQLAKFLFLIVGLLLLLVVVQEANVAEIWREVQKVGVLGVVTVLVLFTLSFWADVGSWHVILDCVPLNWVWSLRLFAIRTIGEAYNNITPTASIGGEPIKAWLLKSNYEIRFREASGSLVLAKTTIVISLVLYTAIGFLLLLGHEKLAGDYKIIGAVGLAMLMLFSILFFLVQWLKISTLVAHKLGNTRFGQRLLGLIAFAEDLDAQFLRVYSQHRLRLLLSICLAFIAWLLLMVEIYCVMHLLGFPISWAEAWIIEAFVQTVRSAVFMIPAGIGAQEGAMFLLCSAITGNPASGLVLALVRRSRELLWIALGLALTSAFSVTLKELPPESV
jgi:uncharacterized membrane protein YbhN (UPF0104 family)